MKRPYQKPSLAHEEQIARLRSRGMRFPDEKTAQFYLQHINYYRLRAYWLSFEVDPQTHLFRDGTEFDERSEERRVGKECRCRRTPYNESKKEETGKETNEIQHEEK